jgi:hypothetical protein
MRRYWTWILNSFLLGVNAAVIVILLASSSLADGPQTPSSPEDAFLSALLLSIGGLKGAGVLAAVVVLTQVVVKFMDTRWAAFAGKWKLLAVSGLTLVGGVAGLMTTEHLSFLAALLHSSTLATFQVFAHQLLKQVTERPDPAPATPPAG